FDDNVTVPPDNLEMVLRRPYELLSPQELSRLLEDPDGALLNVDNHTNDTFNQATRLRSTSGYSADTHYAVLASLEDAADVDFYRFQAAQGDGTTVMTVTTRALLVNGVTPKVEVYENNQTPVTSAQILVNGNGTYIVQVPNARSGANYFVRALA